MKKYAILLLLPLSFAFSLPQSTEDVNAKVIAFVKKNLNKKVGRGQCWDLAQAALDDAKAKWEAPYNFGRVLNYEKEAVKAGDIIRFEKVKFANDNFEGSYPEHTAIIYEVVSPGVYKIAEQNSNNRLYVIISDFELKWKTKGKITMWRPVP